MFLACFQSSNTLSAHFVELRLLAGVNPFASLSKFSSLENWNHSLGRRGCFNVLGSAGRGSSDLHDV